MARSWRYQGCALLDECPRRRDRRRPGSAGRSPTRPPEMDQKSADAWRAALKASASKDPAAKTGAIREVMDAANAGSLEPGQALTLLAMLGDLDGAFAQAQLYEPLDFLRRPICSCRRPRPCVPIRGSFPWRASSAWSPTGAPPANGRTFATSRACLMTAASRRPRLSPNYAAPEYARGLLRSTSGGRPECRLWVKSSHSACINCGQSRRSTTLTVV